MRVAQIHGYVTSTVKHPSLNGQRLLIAQPLDANNRPDGPPQVVIDPLGAAIGQRVIITSDGAEAREIVRDPLSPARWNILGIIDPERSLAL